MRREKRKAICTACQLGFDCRADSGLLVELRLSKRRGKVALRDLFLFNELVLKRVVSVDSLRCTLVKVSCLLTDSSEPTVGGVKWASRRLVLILETWLVVQLRSQKWF